MPTWYAAKKGESATDISIYDEIGGWGVYARDFVADLKEAGDVNLTIHSPGGDVVEGLAIYNAIKKHSGRVVVTVDTMAASMASVIALAGDEVRIAENGFFMVHNPWTVVSGDADSFERVAEDMRKFENVLVNAYVENTGQTEESIRDMMSRETWLDASEAVAMGFASEIVKATKAAACTKDFKGEIHNHFQQWPSAMTQRSARTQNKENNMAENNDKLLELQAKAKDAEAALKAKESEIAELTKKVDKLGKDSAKAIEETRQEAALIVALGTEHDCLEMAIEAIGNGDAVEDFKTAILDSYVAEADDDDEGEQETEYNLDASVAPESREHFLAVHDSLTGRAATAYWNAHKDTFLK
jgi:ATP-dependent Clp endopeptidase proteolytic subunit ClpP